MRSPRGRDSGRDRPSSADRRKEEKEEARRKEEKETKALCKRLAKHYECMANFIRTKCEPTIFYLPARHTKLTRKLLDETRDAISQKVEGLEEQMGGARERSRSRGKDRRDRDRRR